MITVESLCRDLRIKHPLDWPTCIGYGQKQPTCGNLAAKRNREEAAHLLEGIAENLTNGDSPRSVMDDLFRVAKLLHCVRNHQSQAEDKAKEWKRKLDRVVARGDGARQQRQSGSRRETDFDTSNSRRERRSVDTLASARDEDLVNELAQRYSSARRLIGAVVALTDDEHRARTSTIADLSFLYGLTLQRHHDAEGDSDSDSDSDSEDSDSDSEDSDSGFFGSDAESEEDDDPIATSTRVSYQRRQQRRSPAPSPPSVSSTSSSNASSSSRRSAASESKCGICLNRLRSRDDKWRCTTCHNATHADCFDEWMANSREDNVRCIYW